ANGLGLVAVSGALLAVGLRRRLVEAAICGLAAVLTFSRGALLAGAALLVARRLPRRAGIAVAVVLAALAVLLARPLAARFAAPAPDTRDAHRLVTLSGHGRTRLWRIAWREGRDHPLLGGAALVALAVGTACGLHGLGAALLESGRPTQARHLLPGDARPDAAIRTRAAFVRGCRVDPGEPTLRFEAPLFGGCPSAGS